MRADVEKAVQLLQDGGDGAIEQALALLQSTVFNFSMKVCGHREDAEDTMQDVLLKSLPYLPTFSSAKALGVWLYKVARNRCLMGRRRSKFAPQEHLALEELMPDALELERLEKAPAPTPESLLLKKEDADRLQRAVLALSPQYRIVLVLHDMEGLDTSEIGSILDLREGTVRVRLHRARLALRKELARPEQPDARSEASKPEAKKSKFRRCRDLFAQLSEYLDGTLEVSLCDEIQKHMKNCRGCEAFLADLERTVKRCQQYNPADASACAEKMRRELLEAYRRVANSSATSEARA